CSGNLWDAICQALLTRGLTGLCEQSGCTCQIILGQFQAGKKHLSGYESIGAFRLPRQVDTLLRMLLGSIQVGPLIAYAGQAKMGLGRKWQRRLAQQAQRLLKSRSGRRELKCCFLHGAQADEGEIGEDTVPRRLASSNDLGIGPARSHTVSLELVGESQLPGSRRAECQVVGVQIVQGEARLRNNGLDVVLTGGRRCPYGGNPSDQVTCVFIRLSAVQGGFGRL